jgi:endothelin-converting enzyme/putative endopeptidase
LDQTKYLLTVLHGSFNELLKTDKDALDILRTQQKPIYKSNTDQGKAVNLYKTILDTVARDKMGIKPLLIPSQN